MSTKTMRYGAADPPVRETSGRPPGRHRATTDARAAFPPAALPLLLGGVAAVLVAVVVVWQVF